MSNKHQKRVGRALVIISLLLAMLHYYIGARLLPSLHLNSVMQFIAVLSLVFSVVIIPSAMLARFFIKDRRWADAVAWAGLSAMGLFSSLLVLTFIRDIFLIIFSWAMSSELFSFTEKISALVTVVLAVLATLVGFVNARRMPAVVDVNIPIKNLPAELEKFTLVQISDIHIGATIKGNYLAAIVKKVNELNPHVVAITGDLVDGSVKDLGEHIAPLQSLRSSYGTFFVTGNHEYYSGANQWIEFLQSLGIRVLMNEHEIIVHNSAAIIIAGVTDYNAHQIEPSQKSNPSAALSGTENLSYPKIMLAHQPRSAKEVAATGADLQLSGHTHGGQFWPWNFFVGLQQPYNVGLHRLDNLWIYINRGTGYWGPPKRLGGRSEITRIHLVCEK